MKKSYYAIIPAEVRYDKDISANAKLMYGEITALANEKGYCYAQNNYFAELYSVSKGTVSRWVSQLNKLNYITVEIIRKKGSNEIEHRYIRICAYPITNIEHTPIVKKRIDNNTLSINNTINKEKDIKRRFVKPTTKDISDYCISRNNNVDANYFYDFYESKGWTVGKSPMKDWKACVRTWERSSSAIEKPKHKSAMEKLIDKHNLK